VQRHASKHVEGFSKLNKFNSKQPREGCAFSKMPSKAFPPSKSHATESFELIHSDLKELLTRSYHGYKWFILFIDDLTSHAWIINLKAKSDAASAMHDFMAHIRIQHQAKLKRWWFDGGGEFKPMENELQKDGIVIEKSIPHEQQQNGRAEHLISTIMDKAQAIHFTAGLSQFWWEFCVEHGLYLYNGTPMKHTM
jgi:hypothetical protein